MSTMPEPVISVTGVGKTFRLQHAGTQTLKAAVLSVLRMRRPTREFTALHDVGFCAYPGETVGIIGANGAGKSTLLSLIAGTMTPTRGTIRTQGTLSSLLELGAGFHPELTGRENVYLYGAIMGVPQARMRERFDEIVGFAGLEGFIDQPVKHYSSGMYVRLGFSVAVQVDPDILLVDEVLAVGDADFQLKCLKRMDEFRRSGKTMLIISHDLKTIQRISDRILILDEGRIVGLGDPAAMVEQYATLSRQKAARALRREWGTGEVTLLGARFLDAAGGEVRKIAWGDPLRVEIAYRSGARIADPVFGFAVSDLEGRTLYGNNTQIEGASIPCIEGEGRIVLEFPRVELGRGNYLFSFSVHSSDHKVNYHRVDFSYPIEVTSEKTFEGCYMPVRWTPA